MTSPPRIGVRRLPHADGLELPAPASAGSAGSDLRAAVEGELVLAAGERVAVPTGLCLEIPVGWEGQVRPRSGLALRHGITVVNSPGTVDSDYRGEIMVLLVNLGRQAFAIRRGDRIAQFVLAPVHAAVFEERGDLSSTERGAGGFGSTGHT